VKLRFQFNSIRLRLKRGEVAQLARTGRVEETITFGEDAGDTFRFVLETSADVTSPRSQLTAGGLLVRVPAEAAARWAASDEVGIEGGQAAGKQTPLHILIEKDFACLDGPEAENVDTFPHPLAGTKC
jgi:hypothetical protein